MKSISYSLFLFILVFCPLAFGTVEYWSQAVMITGTAVSLLLLCLYLLVTRRCFFQVPGIIPLFLLTGWFLLQLVPLPVRMVQLLSPATVDIYRPLLVLQPSVKWITLTVNPAATLLMLFTFAAYSLFFLLSAYHLHSSARLKQTVFLITGLASIIAIEAILQKLTSPDAIYWFRNAPSNSPVGPWVYSNHFAGFMEMLFPLVIALFLVYRPQIQYEQSMKDRFVGLFTMPGANRYLLLGTSAILIALSILISLSRGGIITLCIAFLFFIFFSAKATRDSRTKWAIFLTLSTVLLVAWFGWQPIIDEFSQIWGKDGLNTSGRLPVLVDSINLFTTHPLFGTGFGTFVDTYPGVRSVSGDAVFDHAHNDYIELLTDGGVLGFALAAWFVLTIITSSLRTMKRRREPFSILITSGALTGMLALLFHSFVDFQMYNGANGLYFFFLCGLAVSGANTRIQFRTRPTLLKDGKPFQLISLGTVSLLLLIAFTAYHFRHTRAEQLAAPLRSTYLNRHISPEKLDQIYALYSQAAEQNPLDAQYRSRLGQIALLLNRNNAARDHFLSACLLQPMSGLYLQQLGLSLDDENKAGKERLLATGVRRDPRSTERYLTYAEWLLAEQRKRDALSVLDRAFTAIPEKSTEIARYINIKQFAPSELEESLSPAPSIWYALGRIMERKKQPEESERFYLKAFENRDKGETRPEYFTSLYALYQRKGESDKALAVLRRGVEDLPDNASFRIMLGDYYRRQGILYRAVEEYQQALNLDPGSGAARQRLKEIGSE